MGIQDAGRLKALAPSLLPLLVDRLNDVKDRYRELAMSSLVEYWRACPSEVEKTIKEVGFGSKSWRIREQVGLLNSILAVPLFSLAFLFVGVLEANGSLCDGYRMSIKRRPTFPFVRSPRS